PASRIELRLDLSSVLPERDAALDQRERQQSVEMIAVRREDRVLAPGGLDAELGAIGMPEQLAPIVFLEPTLGPERHRKPRRRDGCGLERLSHACHDVALARPGQRARLDETRPD